MPNPKSAKKTLRSRGQNAMLGAALLVVLGIQISRFIRLGPQLAAVSAATEDQSVGASSAALPRDVILTFGTQDFSEYPQLMQHTEQVLQTLKSFPATRPVESAGLEINPFLANRPPGPAQDHIQQERSETLAGAQALTLQSIMPSELAPVCLINNVLLRENQQLNGFTVDKINTNSVVIHRGIYRFELRLLR